MIKINMQIFNFKNFLTRFTDDVDNLTLFKVLAKLPSLDKDRIWIAGGAIRRTLIGQPIDSDFDFFFKDEKTRAEFEIDLVDMGFVEMSKSEKNTTFVNTLEDGTKVKAQCIYFAYYNSLEEVIDSFDFTITQFGYDGENLVCGEFSLWDLARRRLAIHKLTFGVSTVRRLIKYTQQGFTACGGVLVDILQRTIADPETLQADIKYID